MTYRMDFPTFDNSGVNTRQVRRQRARLAKKLLPRSTTQTRTDTPPARLNGYRFSTSKYRPHIGDKQIARGLRLLAAGRAF
jgi:hypothetical protein